MRTVNEYAADVKRHYIEACEAVLGRGGSVPSGMGIADLPLAISQIPHDVTLAYHTAESETYRTKVPSNVEKYARINRIGGMTYKCNNLIKPPTVRLTSNGITFTAQEDGSILVNGTATAQATFDIRWYGSSAMKLTMGKTYTLSGCPSGGSSSTFYMRCDSIGNAQATYDAGGGGTFTVTQDTEYYIFIRIAAGVTVNNAVFHPMLNEGTTALPYEPYFEGLRNAAVTEIKSEGVNLIPFPYAEKSKITNGITFTVNDDGSVTVSGTAEKDTGFYLKSNTNPIKALTGKTVTISGGVAASGSYGKVVVNARTVYEDGSTKAFIESPSNRTTGTVPDCVGISISLFIVSGATVNTTIYPMLNYGDVASPYKPYIGEIDKVEIPEAVRQSLADYGCGVDGYRNGIEWRENGRCYYVQRVKRLTLNGTEKWTAEMVGVDGLYRFFITLASACAPTNSTVLSPVICNVYDTETMERGWGGKEGCAVAKSGTSRFYIFDNGFTDVDTFKAHLAELYAAGNPLVFDYALAEPIETDITDLMRDNFIAVEGDGNITAVNEHGYDAETSLTYLINTVGG